MTENQEKYLGLKKFLALIASIGLWAVSMYFSYRGFEFKSTSVLWFGLVLALMVTVVELVFNTKITKLNPTLLIAGIICYLYGTYTNISGFYVLQHGNMDSFWQGDNWLIPIFAGLICEVLPEALFAWSIGAYDAGDLIGNIGEMFTGGGSSKNPVKASIHNYSKVRKGDGGGSRNGSSGTGRKISPEMEVRLPHMRRDGDITSVDRSQIDGRERVPERGGFREDRSHKEGSDNGKYRPINFHE